MMDEKALTELADRVAITELIYRYCRSVDRLDIPLGHSIFHEDAIADYGAHVYQGPARGVIDAICEMHLQFTAHSHQISNVTITLDGDRAGSEAYAIAGLRTMRDGQEIQMTMWPRYLDTWSKRDGKWGIDKRQVVLDFDEIRDVTSIGQENKGSRDKSDPSYGVLGMR